MSYGHELVNLQFVVDRCTEGANGSSFNYQAIMGIITNTDIIRHQDYNLRNSYSVQPHKLPPETTTNLSLFFQNYYGGNSLQPETAESAQRPDNFLFLEAIHRGKEALQNDPGWAPRDMREYELDESKASIILEAGETYMLGTPSVPYFQSILGVERGAFGIGVLGKKQVLALADVRMLMAATRTDVVRRISPSSSHS